MDNQNNDVKSKESNSKSYIYYYNQSDNNTANITNNILNNNSNQNVRNESGYIALYLSLVLVGVLLICFVLSGGNFDENRGIVWLFAGIYIYLGELPVIIVSVIFGIKGLKNENKIPSYASFVINILKIVIIKILLFPK